MTPLDPRTLYHLHYFSEYFHTSARTKVLNKKSQLVQNVPAPLESDAYRWRVTWIPFSLDVTCVKMSALMPASHMRKEATLLFPAKKSDQYTQGMGRDVFRYGRGWNPKAILCWRYRVRLLKSICVRPGKEVSLPEEKFSRFLQSSLEVHFRDWAHVTVNNKRNYWRPSSARKNHVRDLQRWSREAEGGTRPFLT